MFLNANLLKIAHSRVLLCRNPGHEAKDCATSVARHAKLQHVGMQRGTEGLRALGLTLTDGVGLTSGRLPPSSVVSGVRA